MAKIKLPQELLEKGALKSLPAKEKEEYFNNLFKKILDLNPEGVTVSQIKEAAGLTPSTIWHHLEILKCTAQASKISMGNVDVYRSSGNLTVLKEYLYTKGKSRYIVCTLKNDEGDFVCISEKRQNRLGSYTITRGIFIPVEIIDDFVKILSKAK